MISLFLSMLSVENERWEWFRVLACYKDKRVENPVS